MHMRAYTLLATLATIACGSAQPVAEHVEAAAPPSFDLGFEASTAADDWQIYGRDFTSAVVDDEQREGRRSLRFAFRGQGSFGAVAREYPVSQLRGKRVRVSVHLKTQRTIAGWGRVWVDIDAPSSDNGFHTVDQRLWGEADWAQYEITVDVPADARRFHFGALLAGSGRGWVDGFAVDVAGDPPPAAQRTLAGVVVDRADQPIAGALVAAVAPSGKARPAAHVRTDDRGRFELSVPEGTHGLTATATGHGAAYLAPEAIAGPGSATLRLGRAAHTLSGQVSTTAGSPVADVLVGLNRVSDDIADAFYVRTDARGRFAVSFAAPGDHQLFVADVRFDRALTDVKLEGAAHEQNVTTTEWIAAPDSMASWLRTRAHPLNGAAPRSDVSDLAAFGAFVGDARVIGLGEAAHGAREFFQMKHRLFRYLVEHKGFTAIAFELSLAETEAINRYVMHGEGDPRHALGAAFFWIYNTEEVLELVEWMRAYNAAPGRAQKIRFLGFDMQFSEGAEQALFAYLAAVDPKFAADSRPALLPLLEHSFTSRGAKTTELEQREVSEGLTRIRERMRDRRAEYVDRSSAERWEVASQHLQVLQQLHDMLTADRSTRGPVRDEAMAANTLWHLSRLPKGSRIALWAHDLHLQRVNMREGYPSQGTHLARALGDDYRAVGFVFGEGTFQAYDYTGPEKDGRGVREFRAEPGPADAVGRNFARAGHDIFFLDLRPAGPAHEAAEWLQQPRRRKSLGSAFLSQESLLRTSTLTAAFDAVIFVDRITRARPLHNAGWRYVAKPAR